MVRRGLIACSLYVLVVRTLPHPAISFRNFYDGETRR
jgi:hypothetical protein